MALEVKSLTREFVIFRSKDNTVTLGDPNPSMTPSEVMEFYSSAYPELTNSSVSAPKVGTGKVTYKFTTSVGKKG